MVPTRTQVLKYTLLPGLIPRAFGIFTSGFAHTAFLIAIIYNALGLLPAGHPYLAPENFGRFGIRHVIAQAANNLVFKRKNADQIAIFFVVLAGMVLLVMQFALLIMALVMQQPALAAVPMTAFNILGVNSPLGHGALGSQAQDIVFIMLDRIFGVSGIFNSCISVAATPCQDMAGNNLPASPTPYPSAFHTSLHMLFRFYSMGLFLAGVFIILYFVTTLVGETATTGTPFGQRMNKTWAPIRLMMFFALLLPLNIGGVNAGFNGAQIITFHVAKLGSNFATNAWGIFNNSIAAGETHLGDPIRLIAAPTAPQMSQLVKFIFIAKTCKIAEEIIYHDEHWKNPGPPRGIQAYIVRETQAPVPAPPTDNFMPFLTTNFAAALDFSRMGAITVRFGTQNPNSQKHKAQWGNVFPVCGQITIPITKMDRTGDPASGARAIQNMYYQLMQEMWNDRIITDFAECIVRKTIPRAQNGLACRIPDRTFAEERMNHYQNLVNINALAALDDDLSNSTWNLNNNVKSKGWAGAAIWYNRLAQINGELATAIYAQPAVNKYPELLEFIADQRRVQNNDGNTSFDPVLANGEAVKYRKTADRELAAPMSIAVNFWEEKAKPQAKTNNAFIDTINLLFGTSGIFNMRNNDTIHPLAQLSALGKSMMEASIRNIFLGHMGAGGGQIAPDFVGDLAVSAGKLMKTIGMATIAMSFVLFYILPLMPFIYFFFAVSGWVKSIFEALVAMPLWALAHITRIDGNGLPGPTATNGYFLLFEIFLRPILIVFGLVGSITIFSSIVHTLNQAFDMVANVGGFDNKTEIAGTITSAIDDMRGPVDQFFYTAVYVIICYSIGISCFKLIDLIPGKILRYMGISVATFQEGAGDPAGDVMRKTYSGGLLATGQLEGGQLATLMHKK